ncbi:hypothetical protein [Paenibacillus sp. NEAU-GSW1]|uniref:hypothetical protein n=1 Tax=Paenibacillus sp. NEAU-GSW1 TaxID=2682486 RepID=UPI0012E1903F|nr:hypothetical protein [Paenibacillus sp. NEAU-GSW1]MUT68498.1 hypothetical protein [Paenibacillus sp. NEAU-GSW1]
MDFMETDEGKKYAKAWAVRSKMINTFWKHNHSVFEVIKDITDVYVNYDNPYFSIHFIYEGIENRITFKRDEKAKKWELRTSIDIGCDWESNAVWTDLSKSDFTKKISTKLITYPGVRMSALLHGIKL